MDPSLPDIVAAATTIVEGTVVATGSYLSDDQRWVYTDYTINPTLMVFQEKARARSTTGSQPMILRVWGGKLKVGDVEVVAVDENLNALKPDVPLILFLTQDKADPSKYRLVFDVSGAFEAGGGIIRPLLKGDWMLKSERGPSKGEFMKRVYEALQSRG